MYRITVFINNLAVETPPAEGKRVYGGFRTGKKTYSEHR